MSCLLHLKVSNFSKIDWKLASVNNSIWANNKLVKTVSNDLKKLSGMEEMEIDDISGWVSYCTRGNLYLYACWYDPLTFNRFGFQLNFPWQQFTVGASPYWQYFNDIVTATTLDSKRPWIKVSDPAKPVTISTIPGASIVATPTANHDSIVLSIQINQAK